MSNAEIIDTITEAIRSYNRLWTAEDVAEYFQCSESSVFRISAKPGFPEPVQIQGLSGRRWVADEIRAWANSQRQSKQRGPGRPRVV